MIYIYIHIHIYIYIYISIHVRVYYMGGRDHVSEVAHIIPGHRGIARRIAARLCSRHSAGRVGAPGSVGFQGAGFRVQCSGCSKKSAKSMCTPDRPTSPPRPERRHTFRVRDDGSSCRVQGLSLSLSLYLYICMYIYIEREREKRSSHVSSPAISPGE